ncbi:amidohydrolase [Streptomyces sp. NPDC051098]|uniref:amidohydrolase n=1 Tax=Streptomyces sp. NPDC051098 TaxID=3155411 RepID=UPI00342D1840
MFALDLHQHPELSGEEVRTAACLADALEAEGFEVTRNVAGHGVVGVLANGSGQRVMLRTELDALPVEEQTGLPYSAVGALAHACGHDLHIAAVLGAAMLLARSREHWQGTLLVVGQPAEETLSGARALLADGLYARFGRPDVVLAQHSVPLLAGMVAHGNDGDPVLAGSAGLEVTLHGRGGHAGASHLSVNPVLTAASVALRLQSVVERVCTPTEAASLTVGTLHAGVRNNVIPNKATMGISVRAYSQATIDRVVAEVKQVVDDEEAASGSPHPAAVAVVSRSVATIPSPEPSGQIRGAHREAFGPERVMRWSPSMATEDFALYGEAGRAIHGCEGVLLCYWMFGTVGPRQWAETTGSTVLERLASIPPNHSPGFAPHLPTALPAATAAMTVAALTQLKPGKECRPPQ